jgi:peptidoglycan/LPS O-acetylase OafA/YrhL
MTAGGMSRIPLLARSEPALLLAALAWAAAMLHGVAAAQHADESSWETAAFVVLAVAQFGLGAWLWVHPDPRALAVAAAGNAAVIAVWVTSRTVGFPPGEVEHVHVLDLMASTDEALLIAAAVAAARGAGRVLLHPAVVRVALITTLAAAMLAGGHAH